eukprot:4499467-Pyramimonas_sp.AAC.1
MWGQLPVAPLGTHWPSLGRPFPVSFFPPNDRGCSSMVLAVEKKRTRPSDAKPRHPQRLPRLLADGLDTP